MLLKNLLLMDLWLRGVPHDSRCHLQMWSTVFNLKKLGYVSKFLLTLLQTKRMKGGNCSARTQIFFTRSKVSRKKQRTLNSKLRYVFIEKTCWNVCKEASIMTWLLNWYTYRLSCTFFFFQLFHSEKVRHGIFPPIGGFLPIERSHGSFLRSVQIRWENYRVYLTCERFSESNFTNLPRASISFLHYTFLNGVNLFCFGHHWSVHGLTEFTRKGSNPVITCKSAV